MPYLVLFVTTAISLLFGSPCNTLIVTCFIKKRMHQHLIQHSQNGLICHCVHVQNVPFLNFDDICMNEWLDEGALE